MTDFQRPIVDQWGQDIYGVGGGRILPGTGENDVPVTGSPTHNWSNPDRLTNITQSSYANMNTSGGTPYVLPYLRASNYGFAIPAGATMLGVEVELYFFSGNSDYNQDELHISWGASAANFSTTNKASGAAVPGSGTFIYGGPTDLWGETSGTITPTVVNSSDFGWSYKVSRASGSAGRNHNVAYALMTVYYSLATGVGNARVTQVYSETLISQKADAQVTQVYSETLISAEEDALVSQVYAEVLHSRSFITSAIPAGRGQVVIAASN